MRFTCRNDSALRSLLLALVSAFVVQYGPAVLAQAPRVTKGPPAKGGADKAAPIKGAPAQAEDIHASPQKVFEAYRTATKKRDWRTVFECYSPDARARSPQNIMLACSDHGYSPKISAMLKKYHADEASIEARYVDEYKKKYGIDLKKLSVEKPPATDEKLLQKVVDALVVNKAGLFQEASALLENDDGWTSPIRALTGISINGDSAIGQSTTVISGMQGSGPGPGKKFSQVVPATYHFVRVNGKWYVEG